MWAPVSLAMGIKCVLLVNKQGQTRLAKYSDSTLSTEERRSFEAEVVRKCITRVEREVRVVCGELGHHSGDLIWSLAEQRQFHATYSSTHVLVVKAQSANVD